jgi:hypothetical protein
MMILVTFGTIPNQVFAQSDNPESAEKLLSIAQEKGYRDARIAQEMTPPSPRSQPRNTHFVSVRYGNRPDVYAKCASEATARILCRTAKRYGYDDAKVVDEGHFNEKAPADRPNQRDPRAVGGRGGRMLDLRAQSHESLAL